MPGWRVGFGDFVGFTLSAITFEEVFQIQKVNPF